MRRILNKDTYFRIYPDVLEIVRGFQTAVSYPRLKH